MPEGWHRQLERVVECEQDHRHAVVRYHNGRIRIYASTDSTSKMYCDNQEEGISFIWWIVGIPWRLLTQRTEERRYLEALRRIHRQMGRDSVPSKVQAFWDQFPKR